MNHSTKALVTALFGLALLALAARADEQHHQPDATTAAPPAAMPFPQMMMNMMGPQGMPMMSMMGQGGMAMM